MNNKVLILLVSLVAVCGCSKQAAQPVKSEAEHAPTVQAPPSYAPSQIMMVESAEGKEQHEIRAQAKNLLKTGEFEKLDDFARKLRVSKSSFPSGRWKLGEVYRGMIPGDEANEAKWTTTLDSLQKWTESRPDSVTARVALANFYVSYAWKARGGGWADTVTDSGWKLMHDRLTKSLRTLKDAEALQEKCPAQWSVLFSVALGMGIKNSEYDTLFERAVRSEPQYPNYYFARAYYLLPRWYGSTNDTANFMWKSADELGGDDGDLLYARMVWDLQSTIGGNVFDECKLSWERTDKGFKVMEKRFPESLEVKNAYAYMALFGSTHAQPVRALLADLHGKIDLSVWDSKEHFVSLTKCLN